MIAVARELAMLQTTSPEVSARSSGTSRLRSALTMPASAVAAIWLATALMSVLAPDMVTGSEHEHLPIAAITVWLWAALATAFVLLGARSPTTSPAFVLGVAAVWVSTLIAVVASPVMVTGSDPTRIPIAALVAPPVGALVTAFLALQHAATQQPPSK